MALLIRSFTACLGMLSRGKIQAQALEGAWWQVGCAEEHLLNPGNPDDGCDERKWTANGMQAHPVLVKAYLAAKAAGRTDTSRPTYPCPFGGMPDEISILTSAGAIVPYNLYPQNPHYVDARLY